MRIYNLLGYGTFVLQAALCAWLAPAWLGPWRGMAVGLGYLLASWFLCGLYLSDVIHMGIAHRTLDYKEWFIKAVTLLNNTVGIYVDPVGWVNRHRLHHKFADHPGDPNKLHQDGFWRTLWLCVFPYECKANVATDPILRTWPLKLTSSWAFALVSPLFSGGVLWLFVRDVKFVIGAWLGVRIFALWVNMIQNYWTHTRTFGTRRYDDAHDNAMNIGDWLPVTMTFSACWQNNHHHYPHLLRTTHHPEEYDFGFLTVKAMAAMGLVKPSETGRAMPKDLALADLGL